MATSCTSLRRTLLMLLFSPVLLALAYCVAMLSFAAVVGATENRYGALGLALVAAAGSYAYRRRAQQKPAVAPVANPVLAAAYAYQEKSRTLTPTAAEFAAWVASLPLLDRSRAEAAGLANCWAQSFVFRRFVLEGRGHDYVDFLAENLSKEEFCRWVDTAYAQPA